MIKFIQKDAKVESCFNLLFQVLLLLDVNCCALIYLDDIKFLEFRNGRKVGPYLDATYTVIKFSEI
jgi:hypothetical protein